MTLAQLLAKYNELATSLGQPTRKGFDNKSKAEAGIAMLTRLLDARLAIDSAVKLRNAMRGGALKVRKAKNVRVKGPRGFKFGPVWMRSIADGKGIALMPQNMPKLLETATFKNVSVSADLSQAEIVAAIAKTL